MKWIWLFFIFFLFQLTFGQKTVFTLEVINNSNSSLFEQQIKKRSYSSVKKIADRLKEIQAELIREGFLTANIDSIHLDSSTHVVTAFLYTGEQYSWAQLNPGKVDEGVLSKIGFRDRLYNNRKFEPYKLNQLFSALMDYYENNGYPFASIRLDSTFFNSDGISANLAVKTGPFIIIDTIVISGDANISDNYIQSYIGIKPNQPYSEQKFEEISNRIAEIPFVKETGSAEILFTEDKARLELFLTKEQASSFNGVIGFQPDDETGRITITGDVDLDLKNVLRAGEELSLNWSRIDSGTQELAVSLSIPYLFGTPLGVQGDLNIYRRDTSYNNVTLEGAIQYYFKRGNYIEGFIENQTSNLISTEGFENYEDLPANSSTKRTSYGLGYHATHLDYRYNPTKGISFDASFSVGEKEIIPESTYENLQYDTLELVSTQFNIETDISYYIPLFPQTTLKLRAQAAHIENDQLFTNELYLIGGLKTLRGFDEQAIFASSYAIPSVEFRYLLEKNSYLAAFFDYAWYERKTVTEYTSDTPFGFGAGLSFQTNAGVFSLFYALGKQFNNPIEFRSGKIHFGFASLF